MPTCACLRLLQSFPFLSSCALVPFCQDPLVCTRIYNLHLTSRLPGSTSTSNLIPHPSLGLRLCQTHSHIDSYPCANNPTPGASVFQTRIGRRFTMSFVKHPFQQQHTAVRQTVRRAVAHGGATGDTTGSSTRWCDRQHMSTSAL